MQPHTMEELIINSPILATICNIEEQDNMISIIFSVEFGPSTREFRPFGVGHSNNAFSQLGDKLLDDPSSEDSHTLQEPGSIPKIAQCVNSRPCFRSGAVPEVVRATFEFLGFHGLL
jgi:hypothetical protein